MQFTPIKKEKISDVVTEAIKESILRGNFKPGDKLPSERELMGQFKVSRIVIRESIRKLEATNLLVIKRGCGMFVATSDSSAISDALTTALKIQRIDIEEITEARLALEPTIAKLATEKITQEYINMLKININEAQDLVDKNSIAKDKNIDFHGIIAEATQNRVVRLSMKSVLNSVRNIDTPDRFQVERDKAAISFHRRIFKAIKEKNALKTEELMHKHILEVREKLKTTRERKK